jgi:serine/threonine protein phosphatase PrpC
MSIDSGSKLVPLSIDHKPESDEETKRIEGNGGKVYQNQSYIPDPSPDNISGSQTLIGPHRVFPGRLSVSRTIGDIEAKDERYGGNPNVVIATPEIRCFKIRDNYDFIVIGCDGIFEKLNNSNVANKVWESSLQPEDLRFPSTVHARCGSSVDSVLHDCVNKKTLDNITTVIIGFSNYER